jgi:outer membrane biosynthesis protein TonB
MRCWILGAVLAAVVGAGPGCAKAHPSHADRARQGRASYRPLAEVEPAGETPPPAAEEITAIHPLAANQPPSYPDAALAAGCGGGLVPLRVHVGIDGRVSEIGPGPGRAAADDACGKEFEKAVREAVGSWEFVPAYRVRRVPAEAPGAEPIVERVALGVDLDFEFVFTIVGGKGAVESR